MPSVNYEDNTRDEIHNNNTHIHTITPSVPWQSDQVTDFK